MPKKIVSDFGDKKFYLICQDGRTEEWRQNKESTDLLDVVLDGRIYKASKEDPEGSPVATGDPDLQEAYGGQDYKRIMFDILEHGKETNHRFPPI
ncbi:hypothetical protein RMATCC62417_12206 [Rhizopus microsporus]|nr:hypothetical protein RMATCC62417_12206 [Rhizopus microsporus]